MLVYEIANRLTLEELDVFMWSGQEPFDQLCDRLRVIGGRLNRLKLGHFDMGAYGIPPMMKQLHLFTSLQKVYCRLESNTVGHECSSVTKLEELYPACHVQTDLCSYFRFKKHLCKHPNVYFDCQFGKAYPPTIQLDVDSLFEHITLNELNFAMPRLKYLTKFTLKISSSALFPECWIPGERFPVLETLELKLDVMPCDIPTILPLISCIASWCGPHVKILSLTDLSNEGLLESADLDLLFDAFFNSNQTHRPIAPSTIEELQICGGANFVIDFGMFTGLQKCEFRFTNSSKNYNQGSDFLLSFVVPRARQAVKIFWMASTGGLPIPQFPLNTSAPRAVNYGGYVLPLSLLAIPRKTTRIILRLVGSFWFSDEHYRKHMITSEHGALFRRLFPDSTGISNKHPEIFMCSLIRVISTCPNLDYFEHRHENPIYISGVHQHYFCAPIPMQWCMDLLDNVSSFFCKNPSVRVCKLYDSRISPTIVTMLPSLASLHLYGHVTDKLVYNVENHRNGKPTAIYAPSNSRVFLSNQTSLRPRENMLESRICYTDYSNEDSSKFGVCEYDYRPLKRN